MEKFEFKTNYEQGSFLAGLVDKLVISQTMENAISILKKAMKNNFKFAERRIALSILRTERLASHTCFRNDEYYLASMAFPKLKGPALGLIKNGMLGYFEKNTHHGFPLLQLLISQGIVEYGFNLQQKGYEKTNEDGGYYHLPSSAIEKIADLYGISWKHVEWMAFKLSFLLLTRRGISAFERYGDFDIDCQAQKNDEYIFPIINNYLPVDMQLFLKERFKLDSLQVPA